MSVSVGEIVEGTVSDIMNYGAFVKLSDGKTGLVHISEVSKDCERTNRRRSYNFRRHAKQVFKR